jgi:addiction module HigA family antidote
MILSFRCKETEKVWHRRFSKKFRADLQVRARRKLIALHISAALNDLRRPPSNHLEALKKDRQDSGAFGLTSSGVSVLFGQKEMPIMWKSLTLLEKNVMKDKLIPLEHPETFLKEKFMEPLGVSAYRLAKDTGIKPMAISEILRGKRRITPRTGLRLAKFFGVSEGYFVRLQVQYEMDLVKESESEEIAQIHAIA